VRIKESWSVNHDYIFGKNQDRNEAISGKNYDYVAQCRVVPVIYQNRFLFGQLLQV